MATPSDAKLFTPDLSPQIVHEYRCCVEVTCLVTPRSFALVVIFIHSYNPTDQVLVAYVIIQLPIPADS